MTSQALAVQAVIEARPGATASSPGSAPKVTLYKVMDKMFAILDLGRTPGVLVKCDPHLAEVMRETYSGIGHRSHLDRRFWIWIAFDADVPTDEIARLVGHSYALVSDKLTRKQKAALAGIAPAADLR